MQHKNISYIKYFFLTEHNTITSNFVYKIIIVDLCKQCDYYFNSDNFGWFRLLTNVINNYQST